jgi:Zn-dependent M28 family amino/carboxypeptidase
MKADPKRMHDDVAFLTSLYPARNYQNKGSLDMAARYCYEQLSMLDFHELEYQDFVVRSGEKYQNVSALYRGRSDERIIIGAHYDVWEDQPGADDNASAVAGMLETARLLQQHRQHHKLRFTYEFVAYCLEEPPFFGSDDMGSARHARMIQEQKIPLQLMICYEMIGYFSDEPGSQGFPHPALKDWYPDTGNFIIVGGHSAQPGVAEKLAGLMKPHCAIPVYPVSSPITDSLVDLSDHRSYWKLGYPAVMINDTSFLRNPHYHQKSDTIDTLDFEKMGEVVNGVFGALVTNDQEP